MFIDDSGPAQTSLNSSFLFEIIFGVVELSFCALALGNKKPTFIPKLLNNESNVWIRMRLSIEKNWQYREMARDI